MSVYMDGVLDRLVVLSRQYTEATGRQAFICKIPPLEVAERWVFADGKILASSWAAMNHMDMLMSIANISVNEP